MTSTKANSNNSYDLNKKNLSEEKYFGLCSHRENVSFYYYYRYFFMVIYYYYFFMHRLQYFFIYEMQQSQSFHKENHSNFSQCVHGMLELVII